MSAFKFSFGNEASSGKIESQLGNQLKSSLPRPAKEHAYADEIFQNMQVSKLKTDISTVFFTDQAKKLNHYASEFVVNMYEKSLPDKTCENSLSSHLIKSDLVKGVYEGGFKIWECALDLTEYILEDEKLCVKDKNVFELGCGAGLPGIMCLKLDAATVKLQDYNPEVIDFMTIPTVKLNFIECDEVRDRVKFYSGDWGAISDIIEVPHRNNTCDLVLSAETIYNPETYEDLFSFLKSHLSKTGVALFAAKSCYFGVGGSVEQFKLFISCKQCFTAKTVKEITANVRREIIEIKWIDSC